MRRRSDVDKFAKAIRSRIDRVVANRDKVAQSKRVIQHSGLEVSSSELVTSSDKSILFDGSFEGYDALTINPNRWIFADCVGVVLGYDGYQAASGTDYVSSSGVDGKPLPTDSPLVSGFYIIQASTSDGVVFYPYDRSAGPVHGLDGSNRFLLVQSDQPTFEVGQVTAENSITPGMYYNLSFCARYYNAYLDPVKFIAEDVDGKYLTASADYLASDNIPYLLFESQPDDSCMSVKAEVHFIDSQGQELSTYESDPIPLANVSEWNTTSISFSCPAYSVRARINFVFESSTDGLYHGVLLDKITLLSSELGSFSADGVDIDRIVPDSGINDTPKPPTDVVIDYRTFTSSAGSFPDVYLDVDWNRPADNTDGTPCNDIAVYEVLYSKDGGQEYFPGATKVNTGRFSQEVSFKVPVEQGDTIIAAVCAVDRYGNPSLYGISQALTIDLSAEAQDLDSVYAEMMSPTAIHLWCSFPVGSTQSTYYAVSGFAIQLLESSNEYTEGGSPTWPENWSDEIYEPYTYSTDAGGNYVNPNLIIPVLTNRWYKVRVKAVYVAGYRSTNWVESSIMAVYENPSGVPTFDEYYRAGDPEGVPAPPTGLTANVGFKTISLNWDRDVSYALWRSYEVYEGTSAGFTPDTDSFTNRIVFTSDVGYLVTKEVGTGPWYFKVCSVNTRGERSSFVSTGPHSLSAILSGEIGAGQVGASELADLSVDNGALQDLAVSGDKIQASTITGAKIAAGTIGTNNLFVGSLDNLVQDPSLEGSTHFYSIPVYAGTSWAVSTTYARSGSKSLRATVSSQTSEAVVSVNGPTGVLNNHPAASTGDRHYFEFWVRSSSTTSNSVRARIEYRSSSGTVLQTDESSPAVVGTSWSKVSVATSTSGAPISTAYVVFLLVVNDDNLTSSLYFDDCYARKMLEGSVIVDGTLTAAHLASGTITAASGVVGSLSADSITTGTLSSISLNSVSISASTLSLGKTSVDDTTNPGTYIGSTGTFMIGPSASHYIKYNGSTLEVKGGTFSASVMTTVEINTSILKLGKASLADTASGAYIGPAGTFHVGKDSAHYLKYDGTSVTLAGAILTAPAISAGTVSNGKTSFSDLTAGYWLSGAGLHLGNSTSSLKFDNGLATLTLIGSTIKTGTSGSRTEFSNDPEKSYIKMYSNDANVWTIGCGVVYEGPISVPLPGEASSDTTKWWLASPNYSSGISITENNVQLMDQSIKVFCGANARIGMDNSSINITTGTTGTVALESTNIDLWSHGIITLYGTTEVSMPSGARFKVSGCYGKQNASGVYLESKASGSTASTGLYGQLWVEQGNLYYQYNNGTSRLIASA